MDHVECVIFDFGKVIANFKHERVSQALSDLAGDEWDQKRVHDEIFKSGGIENGYDRGKITTSEFLEALRKKFGIQASDKEIEVAWCDMFSPNESVITLIPKLRTMCYRLILASNTNELHHRWFLPRYPVLDCFHSQVLSFQTGYRKPEPEFFQECLKRAEFPARQCLYVDDIEEYVKAASDLGMKAVQYTSTVSLLSEMERFGIPNLDGKPLSEVEVQSTLTVYSEKYATYRHLDNLRWKVPASVFAVAAIVGGLARDKPNFPWKWTLLFFGPLALLSRRLMRRIRINLNLNTKVLSRTGFRLGDYSIPAPPGRSGASYLFEMLMAVMGWGAIAVAVILFVYEYLR